MVTKDNIRDNYEPGVGIDARGGQVIDPTQNVRELVIQESKYQDAMRNAMSQMIHEKIDGVKEMLNLVSSNVVTFQNAQRDAETRRIDELAQTRQEFQNTIRDMLAESVRTTSTLVSTQLVQIQATFDTRVSKLEAGAFTQAGKSSVADPQLADFMRQQAINTSNLSTSMGDMVAKMNSSQADALAKMTLKIAEIGAMESGGSSRRMGQGQVVQWLVMASMLMAAIAGPVVTYIAMKGH